MGAGEIDELRSVVHRVIAQETNIHQLDSFMRWLEDLLLKYRERTSTGSNNNTVVKNSSFPGGGRFTCACGRSYSTEINIREVSNSALVDSTSPPATPVFLLKTDQQGGTTTTKAAPNSLDVFQAKRCRLTESQRPLPSVDHLHRHRQHLTACSGPLPPSLTGGQNLHWSDVKKKSVYDRNSHELMEDDADEQLQEEEQQQQCLVANEEEQLEDLSVSPHKPDVQMLFGSGSSSSNSSCSSGENEHQWHPHPQQHEQDEVEELVPLKPVNNEPLSPPLPCCPVRGGGEGERENERSSVLEEENKFGTAAQRLPLLVAYTDPDAHSPHEPTLCQCACCHQTFQSLMLGQEHARTCHSAHKDLITLTAASIHRGPTGSVVGDAGGHTSNNSTSMLDGDAESSQQPSPAASGGGGGSPLFDPLQEDLDDVLAARIDAKAACPICGKMFSSVHTMIRHKTSIHDRQVRYGCNICGRFFFRKDKLTSHMVYHQDYDTFICCFCSLGCKSRMLMRAHLRRDHVFPGGDSRMNDILARCQVKKSLNLETNTSVAFHSIGNGGSLAGAGGKRSSIPISQLDSPSQDTK